MNPRLRPEVEAAFAAALEAPDDERSAFLDRAYPHDPELRAEVASLLRAYAAAGGFLELPEAAPRQLPAAIGRYRIVRLVGEGGMGSVYEAEQDHPRRTVALKVIRAGFAGPELLRRFEREAETLGRLQHPGIAQIYEAGAADSGFGPQPYFAMEFIRGAPLAEFAAARAFSVRERLEVVARICDAAYHAHQRGTVHRDLKPANILVDESGQPKILDLGVAFVTDRDARATRQTDLGQLVGTLAYMSPEQALADPLEVDARSDVYALGVILYELLAGRLPYPVARHVHEAVRAIREDAPPALGSVNRACRGDIETIVARALEKDKERRYGSAAELAADIRRFLASEPIVARPPSAAYLARMFARRHRALVAGVAAVFLALAGGIVASTWEAARARKAEQAAFRERDRAAAAERSANQERDRARTAESAAIAAEAAAVGERNHAVAEKRRADTEAATAKAIDDFLQNDLLAQASAIAQARPDANPDPDLKVRTALDRAAARIGARFDGKPVVESSIRQTIGTAYMDLGVYAEAERHLSRALELRRGALGPDHPDTLTTMTSLGELYRFERKYAEGESITRRVWEARSKILGAEHPDTLMAMNNLAALYRSEGKYADAEPLRFQVLEARRRVLGENHPDTVTSMNDLAVNYAVRGKYHEAEPLFAKVVEEYRRVLNDEHPYTLAAMNNLAAIYRTEGKYGEAEPLFARVVEIRRRVLGEEHPDTLLTMNNLARLNLVQKKLPEAEALYTKVVEGRRRALGVDNPATTSSMMWLGQVRLERAKHAEAESLLREALAGQEKKNPDTWERYQTASLLGAAVAAQMRFVEAEPLLIAGYQGLMRRKTTIPSEVSSAPAEAGQRIVRLYQDWGKPDEAARWTAELRPLHP